jgi:hypothetical protein
MIENIARRIIVHPDGTPTQYFMGLFERLVKAVGEYTERDWTPVIDFSTHGNLVVTYASRSGHYIQLGDLVVAFFSAAFTPTFTTSAGTLQVSSLPVPADTAYPMLGRATHADALTYPAGVTNIAWQAVTSTALELWGYGSGVSGASNTAKRFGVTQFTSGTAQAIYGAVAYKAA